MSLVELIHRLQRQTWCEELADAIWLASLNFFEATPVEPERTPNPDTHDDAEAERAEGGVEKATSTPQASQKPPSSVDPGRRVEPPSADLTLPHPHSVRTSSRSGIPMRAPSARALPGSRAIARSLRPLRRWVASRTAEVFDEEDSASNIAELGIWCPTLRPAQSRWLDMALVIDESPSMAIWRDTLHELRSLLAQLGAFRDVRVWWLDTSDPRRRTTLRARPNGVGSASRAPGELVSSDGSRIVLIASDCIAPAWESGGVAQLATQWGTRQPVAILQLLPQELWQRTALDDERGVEYVFAGSTQPGIPNAHLDWRAWRPQMRREPDGDTTDSGGDFQTHSSVSFPVLVTEPESLGPWAKLIRFGSPARVPAVRFPLTPIDSTPDVDGEEEPLSPQDALIHFRDVSSELAFQLAGLFAAIPLQLPVMRLVQSSLLPESRQVHLAEFFLSGLIQRETPAQPDPMSKEVDPDWVLYEFLPGIRELLLDDNFAADSVEVLHTLSRYLEERIGRTLDFDAILKDPDSFDGMEIDAAMAPFAKISAQVLKRLGGRYAAVAARLAGERGAHGSSSPAPTPVDAPLLGKRILWVEAEATDVESESRTLQSLGATTETVNSLEGALERTSQQSFDAIISEAQLGSDSFAGIQLLDSLQSRGNFTPVAIYTADPFVTPVQVASRHGLACSHDFSEILAALTRELAKPGSQSPAPPPHLPDECEDRLQTVLEQLGHLTRPRGQETAPDGSIVVGASIEWDDVWTEFERNSSSFGEFVEMVRKVFEAASGTECRVSEWQSFMDSAEVQTSLTARSRQQLEQTLDSDGHYSLDNISSRRRARGFAPHVRSWYVINLGQSMVPGSQGWLVRLQSTLPYALGARHLEWLQMLADSLLGVIDRVQNPEKAVSEYQYRSISSYLGNLQYPWQVSILLRTALRLEALALRENEPDPGACLACREILEFTESLAYLQESFKSSTVEELSSWVPPRGESRDSLAECARDFAGLLLEGLRGDFTSPTRDLNAFEAPLSLLSRIQRALIDNTLALDASNGVGRYYTVSAQLRALGPLWTVRLEGTKPLPVPAQPTGFVLVSGTIAEGRDRLLARLLGRALAAGGFGLITGGSIGLDTEVTRTFLERLELWGLDRAQWLIEIPEVGAFAGPHESGTVLTARSGFEALRLRFERARAVVVIGGEAESLRIGDMARETDTVLIPFPGTGGAAARLYSELSRPNDTGEGSGQLGRVELSALGSAPLATMATLATLLRHNGDRRREFDYRNTAPDSPFRRNLVAVRINGRSEPTLSGTVLARPRVIVARTASPGLASRQDYFELFDSSGNGHVSRELFRLNDDDGQTLILEVPQALDVRGLECNPQIVRPEESLWIPSVGNDRQGQGEDRSSRFSVETTADRSVPDGPLPLVYRSNSAPLDPYRINPILLGTPVFDETQQLRGLLTFAPPYSLSMIPASNWYRRLLVHYGALKVLGPLTEPTGEFGVAAYERPPPQAPGSQSAAPRVEDSSGQTAPVRHPNTPETAGAFRAELCSKLERRIVDPSVEWAYHPRAGLGRLITECLVDVMKRSSAELERAVRSAQIWLQEGARVGSSERSRRTDLVIERVRPPRLLAAVEAKVCMTEHSKARPRLIDELRSSLDILLQADPRIRVFFVVVVNFSEQFTSPTRLPGPNLHSPNAGLKLFNSIYQSFSGLEGLAGLLLVPIDFDNVTRCRAVPDPRGNYLEAEAEFMAKLAGAALAQ